MANYAADKVVIDNSITAKFDQGVESYTPFYPTLCNINNSRRSEEKYAFMGNVPGMREFLGDRDFHELVASDYTLKNKKYENSLLIDRDNIDDDLLGMYGDPLRFMGEEAMAHPDKLLFEVLVAGASQKCIDGQNFFDTDHAFGDSGTQSNSLAPSASTPAAPTEAEFRTAFHAAFNAIRKFKRSNGEPWMRATLKGMDASKLFVFVPPDMEEPALKALKKTLVAAGETNIVLNDATVLAVPYLTDNTTFYTVWAGGVLKPFVFQARSPLKRQVKGQNDIEGKDVKFMTEARYNVGYGGWWNAVKSTFA